MLRCVRAGVCVLAMSLLVASSASGEGRGLSPEQVNTVERLVSEYMSANDVPGLTVAVAVDNGAIWSAGYGMADIENFVPATARTKIRTASITKWMTATAAMRLVEEGKLLLDAAPQGYCKAYPRKQWPMTVTQLLNHTAGVRHYHGNNGEPLDTEAQRQTLVQRQREENLGQFVRYSETTGPLVTFKDDPLLFEPGTRYQYTSHGYRLLGCVLANASGETYSALMMRTVFGPAEMRDTTDDDAWAIIARRAAGYVADAEGEIRRADFRDVSENLPAGGHLSTARDLVSFALAFNAGRLVKPMTIRRMLQRPNLPGKQDPNDYYGFGVGVRTLPDGRQMLSHTGGQSGTSTCLETLPEVGFAVAVMTNKEHGLSHRLCESVRHALVKPAR